MSRLIYVPQFPSYLRYQEFWYTEFSNQFKKYFDEVIVLGESYNNIVKDTKSEKHMFSPIQQSIILESTQINEFYNIKINQNNDILFVSDLSFSGVFPNILHHTKIKQSYCYCHGTSKNNYDYFQPVRKSKWLVESGHAKLFKKVFVGSNYHKQKLGWKNIKVIGVPIPPFKTFQLSKKYDIISVSRPSVQKVNKSLEEKIEKDFGKIIRKETNSWEDYYKFLSEAKIVLLSGKEETFGYQVLESIMNHSIPLAPNKFSYPELLEKEYLYSDYEDLKFKIWKSLNGQLLPPIKLRNQELVDNFYNNLIKEMKGE